MILDGMWSVVYRVTVNARTDTRDMFTTPYEYIPLLFDVLK